MNPSCGRAARAFAASFAFASTAALAGKDLQQAGDFLQIALPMAGWGLTYYYDDDEGRRQLYKSAAANMGTILLMKGAIGKLRPDGSSPTSYPSGHTNGAFFGAAFINSRYGRAWGIPAYALALMTGYSRVDADRHFSDDVVAGASIALLYNWALVTPISKNVALGPMQVASGYGLGLRWLTDAAPQRATFASVATGPTRFRFEYLFTPASQRRNRVRAPGGTGTEFDLNDFREIDDPTSASVAEFEWRLNERHSLAVQLLLFEARDIGTLARSTSFAGASYPAGATVRSAYRSYSMPLIYRFDLAPNRRWIARIGASLVPVRTTVELADGTRLSRVVDSGTALLPNIMVGARFARKYRVTADASGLSSGKDEMFEAGLRLTYALGRQWEAAFGYRRYTFRLDSQKLFNDAKYDAWQIGVAHLW